MARPDKVAAVADVRDNLASSAATLLTNYRGLTVAELAELRAELRKANASYRVTKNTLTRIAAREAGLDGLDDFLVGPTALVFCQDDPVGPAKALKAFAKDHPALEVKGGYLDGGVLSSDDTIKLADLASRDELLTRLAGLMHGALANTARLLAALPQKQAQLIQALIDAGGAPGAPADEPAATEPEATESVEPEATEADEPETTEAAEPETTEAAEPETTEAAEPEAAEAAEPEAAADEQEPAAEPEAADANEQA